MVRTDKETAGRTPREDYREEITDTFVNSRKTLHISAFHPLLLRTRCATIYREV